MVVPPVETNLGDLHDVITSIEIRINHERDLQLSKEELSNKSNKAKERLAARLAARKKETEKFALPTPPEVPVVPPSPASIDESSMSAIELVESLRLLSPEFNSRQALPLIQSFAKAMEVKYTSGSGGKTSKTVQFSDEDRELANFVFGVYEEICRRDTEKDRRGEYERIRAHFRDVTESPAVMELKGLEGLICRVLKDLCGNGAPCLGRVESLPRNGAARLHELRLIHNHDSYPKMLTLHIINANSDVIVDVSKIMSAIPLCHSLHLVFVGFTAAQRERLYPEDATKSIHSTMFTTRLVFRERAAADGRRAYITFFQGGYDSVSTSGDPDLRDAVEGSIVIGDPDLIVVVGGTLNEANMQSMVAALLRRTYVSFVDTERRGWIDSMYGTCGEMGFLGDRGKDVVGLRECKDGGWFIVECGGADIDRIELSEQKPQASMESGDPDPKRSAKEDEMNIPAAAPQFLKDLIVEQGAKHYTVGDPECNKNGK